MVEILFQDLYIINKVDFDFAFLLIIFNQCTKNGRNPNFINSPKHHNRVFILNFSYLVKKKYLQNLIKNSYA